jgi:hypothetical protein
MILRRLTKHVKDQNWFAVGLDFFIVVAGILIAFQITNWSATHQDNLIYEQARTRVIEEANANLSQAQNTLKQLSGQQIEAVEIIQDLATCKADVGAEERFMRTIQSLRLIAGLTVRSNAISQILTSDAFLNNISPEDRSMLSVYARRIDTVAGFSQFSDSFQLNRSPPQDNPIFKRTLDGDFGNGLALMQLTVSYEQACQDIALNQFLFDRLENGSYIIRLAKSLAKASREVLIGLGESLPETPEFEEKP